MPVSAPEVAVIGAGPTGLLTALILARQGVSCTIFEKHPALSAHPKAMGITRRTAEIFRQLGILPALVRHDLPPPEFSLALWSTSLVGEIHGRIPLEPPDDVASPCPAFHCPQPHIERTLLEALSAEPLASVLFDHRVTAVAPTDSSVELSITPSANADPIHLPVPWLVAADGAASPTRHALEVSTEGPGDQGHFLNVFFRAAYGPHLHGRRAVMHNLLARDSFEPFVAVNGNDLWLLHHFLQPGGDPARLTPDRLTEIIRTASGLPNVPVEIHGISPWVMSPKIATRFRSGRVLLTGDASARLSPTGGLGMNTGLQSAHNLAWKLAAVIRGASETLLDSYEAERGWAARRNFTTSDTFRAEIFAMVAAGVQGDFTTVRETLAHSARTRSSLNADLGWQYPAGNFLPEPDASPPLNPDTFHPTGRPGTRAPHLWLHRSGERISSLDLFGKTFVLLTTGDPAAWNPTSNPPDRVPLEIHAVPEAADLYGLNPGGASLVRPDGVIAWRAQSQPPDPQSALASVFSRLLRSNPQTSPHPGSRK